LSSSAAFSSPGWYCRICRAIEEGNLADATFLAGLSVSLGILDAACMAG
jgi:uncharacterized membrane protein YjfL (UPF0719 family)